MTFLGHEDPQPTHDPDPSAPAQDPFVDDPVPRYLASLTPVARQRTGRRRAVVVGAMATLVVLVGGGSAIAGLIDNSGSDGRVGAPVAAETSMSPTPSGAESSVPSLSATPSAQVTTPTPGAPATGVGATTAPGAQVPPMQPAPATTGPQPDPTGTPSALKTHDGTVKWRDLCVGEAGWVGYGENGARFICKRRRGEVLPHWEFPNEP